MITLNGHPIEIERYPNGESRIDVDPIHVKGRGNFVRFGYHKDGDLLHLAMVAHHIEADRDPGSRLFIEYMPYSRMDRVKECHQVFTLKTVCELINGLGFSGVEVVEPHSDVTCALLDRSEPVSIIPKLLERVKKEISFDDDVDALLFPDAGAEKRYGHLATKHSLVAQKHRDFSTGQITGLELWGPPPVPSAKVIIVDDLCSYGGTFVRCAQALGQVQEIHLVVAHAETSIGDGNRFFDLITHVHTTSSIQPYPSIERQMTVYPLGGLL